jgi:hypothetical protein
MTFCTSCAATLENGSSECQACGQPIPQAQTPAVITVAQSEPVAAVKWTVLQAHGGLALAESETEYAVYDQAATYGRWPKNPEGHRFANETFGAHTQSAVHGLAYAATGYQDPARLGLPTTPVLKSQTYASPMSYVGSTRRIVAWAMSMSKRNPGLAVLGWVLAVLTLLIAWAVIGVWYVLIFGVFGIFMFPYRLIRRSQRKSHHIQKTALATQQAMLQQQQALLQQQMAQQQAMARPVIAPPASPPPMDQLPPSG